MVTSGTSSLQNELWRAVSSLYALFIGFLSQDEYLVLDVTEAESDKILATLDPLAGMAEVDNEAWASLIDGIQFTEAEFGDLLQELRPGTKSGLTDEDAVPEPLKEPITKPGDLWTLGPHRLLCGDCTELANVERLLDDEKAVLMLTDPPYGINIVKVVGATVGGSKPVTIGKQRTGTMSANGPSPFGGVKKTGTVGARKMVDATEYYPIHGDDKPFSPTHLIGLAERHILFGGNYFASRLPEGSSGIRTTPGILQTASWHGPTWIMA